MDLRAKYFRREEKRALYLSSVSALLQGYPGRSPIILDLMAVMKTACQIISLPQCC